MAPTRSVRAAQRLQTKPKPKSFPSLAIPPRSILPGIMIRQWPVICNGTDVEVGLQVKLPGYPTTQLPLRGDRHEIPFARTHRSSDPVAGRACTGGRCASVSYGSFDRRSATVQPCLYGAASVPGLSAGLPTVRPRWSAGRRLRLGFPVPRFGLNSARVTKAAARRATGGVK